MTCSFKMISTALGLRSSSAIAVERFFILVTGGELSLCIAASIENVWIVMLTTVDL